MPEYITLSFPYFWPEITLAITFVAAMMVEFLFRGQRKLTASVVLFGFVSALLLLPFVPADAKMLFGTMYVSDPFSLFFKYFIIASGVVIVLFSLQSAELARERVNGGEFFCYIAALTLGMVLMSGASNLLMMYMAIELVSLSSYILAGFSKSSRRSIEAAMKYVLYGGVSSALMLYGISILYGLAGSLDLSAIQSALAGGAIQGGWSVAALIGSIVLILAGFGYKISAVPFHFWTPDVYEGAPITVTAFLAVASKAAGFAIMLRFFYVTFFDAMIGPGYWISLAGIDWNIIIAILSVLTMTLGNFVAIWQDNLKRMLAYSSIAHAGYMLMGVVVMSNAGLTAILLYFMVYFFMNVGAFYVVMVIADKLGSEHIDDYRGLGKRAPLLGVALTIFLMSLTGLPPTAGFVGKLMLFSAVLDSKFIWLAIVGALNSVVSLYYYARVFRNMYLRDSMDGDESPVSFPPVVAVVLVLFIIPNIVFGLYFQPLLAIAQNSITILIR